MRQSTHFSSMLVAASLLLVIASQVAHAAEAVAEGEAKEPSLVNVNPTELIFTVVIFLVVLVILRLTAWKPILAGLKGREAAIREALEAAAKAREDAARTTLELEGKIAEAQRVGAQALAQAKQEATQVAETIRTKAEAEASSLKERTLRDIEAAKQQAVAEITAHAAELGTAVAQRILQRQITVEDQERLVGEAVAQMQAGKNN